MWLASCCTYGPVEKTNFSLEHMLAWLFASGQLKGSYCNRLLEVGAWTGEMTSKRLQVGSGE